MAEDKNLQEIIPEGKIKDRVDGKYRNDTPEEYVRQTIESRLLYEHKYKAINIAIEYTLKIGSRNPRADIVIWDDDSKDKNQDTIKIIIECKNDSVSSEDSKDGIAQLKSYMAACPNCEWGMWTNSISKFVFRKELNSSGQYEFNEYNDIPDSDGNIEEINRPTRERLKKASDDNLLFVFRTCHNYIYANDGMHKQSAFFEFLKIIFCKIQDERNLLQPLQFYATSGECKNPDGQLTVAKRIAAIFAQVKKNYSEIFDKDDEIRLTARSLAHIVSILQRYSLLDTNIDIKGKAYEEIVGSNLRGDRGEFFTPRNVTKMVVEMIDPGLDDTVLDSSCGTGGFLVTAMTYVIEKLRSGAEKNLGTSEYMRLENVVRDRITKIAANQYFGFDLNPDLAKATRMNMVMSNDGSGNILQVNSLLPPHMWPTAFKTHIAKLFNIDISSISDHRNIALFDVIVTNPPFGSKIPIKDEAILRQYDLAHIWKHDKKSGPWTMTDNLQSSVPPEILFIERCTQFLKEGGKMGIVLPDSILNSPGLGYIRQWILLNHKIIASIDLTPDTFQPHNGTQTSVLILQKKTEAEKNDEAVTRHIANYDFFAVVVDRVGHDRRGNVLYKRDNEGNEILTLNSEGKPERIIDDQTQEIAGIFGEWQKKKRLLTDKTINIKYRILKIDEILHDKYLRLEARIFINEGVQALQVIENGKYKSVKFEELASSYTGGRTVKVIESKSPYPFFQPSSVMNIKPDYDGYLYSNKESNIDFLRVHSGQILLTCSGTTGRAVYVSKTLDNKILSQDMIRINCNNPEDSGYIYAYFKSSAGQNILAALAYGSVIQHINPELLRNVPVPDAPVELRRKIHELVVKSYALRDESNSMLDDAENLLIRELALIPIDELEENCRNKSHYINFWTVNIYDLAPDLRLDAAYYNPLYSEIIKQLKNSAEELVTIGDKRVSRKIILPGRFKRFYVSEKYGAVFIGGKQINELDPYGKKYLSFSQHKKRIREQLTIHKDMTLITCSGTIGNIALVPEHWEGWTASQHVIRVIPASENIAGYLYVFLASEYGRALIKRYKYGAVIDEINDEHVASVPFPLMRDSEVQSEINRLALEANAKRFQAYKLEREALNIIENEIISL